MARSFVCDWRTELARAQAEGLTAGELAQRLSVHRGTVYSNAKIFHVKLPDARRGMRAKADWATVLPIHAAEGWTLGKVAARYGITKAAVHKQCRLHGVKLRSARAGVKEQGGAV